MTDLAVVGAGVIGLGVAWRCRQRGLAVTVLDPAPGSGASWTAAGMLAAETELYYGERPLFELCLESAHRYPAFAAELADASGRDVGYRHCGTLVAAWDAADLAGLRDLHAYAASIGRTTELLGGRELRRLEPALASGLPGGLLAADDHQVDNRMLHAALLAACERAGVTFLRDRVVTATPREVRVAGGRRVAADHVLLAAGAWSGELAHVPVRPVKGQTVRLRTDGTVLQRTVRGSVRGSHVYVVPRTHGEVVIGASSEEAGFDLRPRAGVVYELLRDAQSLVPALGEAEFIEVSTSVRPGSPDNAPILGVLGDGMFVATGHYRNGILLTPVTADAMSELIVDGRTAGVIEPFRPARFSRDDLGRTRDNPHTRPRSSAGSA